MDKETVATQIYSAVEKALDAGWSINAIAKAADVHQSTIHNWYSGRRNSLALETVVALCSFFEMRLTKAKVPKPPHKSGEGQEPRRKPKAKSAGKKSRKK